MAVHDPREIAEKLADRTESVCRRYLPKGRREGNYWMIGDATGAPGRSMYVRLRGPLSGRGAAGRWTDSANGEHGDMLDLIRHACGFSEFRDVIREARQFLSLPEDPVAAASNPRPAREAETPADGRTSAVKLFSASRPIRGTIAETYLLSRGLTLGPDFDALRFHPRCFYGAGDNEKPETWPALVAAVTDLAGDVTGISRTFLARDGTAKAPIETPRRSKGDLLGHGIRFGVPTDTLTVGEGTETTLSIRAALPAMPIQAATSSTHLSAILFPSSLRTLIVIRDNDAAGDNAMDALFTRGKAAGIDVHLLDPELGDLNDDLTKLGPARLREIVRRQLPAAILDRFMPWGPVAGPEPRNQVR